MTKLNSSARLPRTGNEATDTPDPKSGRKRFFAVVFYAIFALIVGVVGIFIWQNKALLADLRNVHPAIWLAVLLAYFGSLVLRGFSFDIQARAFSVRIPLTHSLALTSAGMLGNYALPGNTSILLRSIYLKRTSGLEYSRFVPLALAAFVFSTGLYGVVAGIAAWSLGPVQSTSYNTVLLLFSGGGVALMIFLLLPLPYERLPKVGRIAALALEGWRRLLASPKLLGAWFAIEFFRAICEVIFFYLTVRMLGVDISIVQALIITLAKECSIFIRLTPGSIGVAEGVQAFFAVAFGLNPTIVVLAGLLGRVIELVELLVVAIIFVPRIQQAIARGRDLDSVEPGAIELPVIT
jgi:uncharacterized membrane protein YbhN (UPF0104 family)